MTKHRTLFESSEYSKFHHSWAPSRLKRMPRLKFFDPGIFQGHIMTGSHAPLFSRFQGTWVSDVIYRDISAAGTILSTGLSAIHLLERRWSAVMEKYASLQKEQFRAITVALLYLVNPNKRGGYLYLSNLINWKNCEDFSIQTLPFLVHKQNHVL